MRNLAAVMGLGISLLSTPALACTTPVSVCLKPTNGSFTLISAGRPASLYVDQQVDPAVQIAADGFAKDLERVSGRPTVRLDNISAAAGPVVIVGVAGANGIIDRLVREGKINASDLSGQWEAFRQVVVENPLPNVARALVVVGSDRRGAAYGLYDLSEKIGVSPWHYFADVPVTKKADVFVTAGNRRDQPKVRYRGIFINDEDPAFSGWAKKQFDGVNSKAPACLRPHPTDERQLHLAGDVGQILGP